MTEEELIRRFTLGYCKHVLNEGECEGTLEQRKAWFAGLYRATKKHMEQQHDTPLEK